MSKAKKNEASKGPKSEDGKDGEDYEVGYRKPPEHTRFKKDNTFGRGRKKGSKGLKKIVNEAFGKKVAGVENGKKVKKTKTEIGINQIANLFAKGDPRATDKALYLLERYGPQDDPEGPSQERVEANVSALRAWLAMREQRGGSGEEPVDEE